MQALRWQKLQYRTVSHHPSSMPIPLHCTKTLWLGLMAPDSNISCRWLLTSSTNGGGICLNCSLKGVSSVTFMVCSVEWVQPNSTGSNENTSWYLARMLVCSICQLWGPGIQATQVQLFKQFTMSLPNSQPRGMGIMGLISPLHQVLTLRGFGHRQCSYHPGHWGFLLEGL